MVIFFAFYVHAQGKGISDIGGGGLGKVGCWTFKVLIYGFMEESQPAVEILKHNR